MDFHKEILNRRICIAPMVNSHAAFRYFYNFLDIVSNDEMVQKSAQCGFVVHMGLSEYRHRFELNITHNDVATKETIKELINDPASFLKCANEFKELFWGYMLGCSGEDEIAATIAGAMDLMYIYKYKHGTEGIGNVH